MLADVVVDTNVWIHAGNPDDQFFQVAVEFLTELEASGTALCIDPGFSLIEADNRSIIGNEYLQHVRWVTTSYQVLVTLLSRGQFVVVELDVHPDTKKVIEHLVPNTVDRQFLRLTVNSAEHVLVSHDFDDFADPTRAALRTRIGCHVETASQVQGRL